MLQEVQYSREGKSMGNVPANTLAVFRFVKEAFVIPNNFEKDHKVSLQSVCVRVVFLCLWYFFFEFTVFRFFVFVIFVFCLVYLRIKSRNSRRNCIILRAYNGKRLVPINVVGRRSGNRDLPTCLCLDTVFFFFFFSHLSIRLCLSRLCLVFFAIATVKVRYYFCSCTFSHPSIPLPK